MSDEITRESDLNLQEENDRTLPRSNKANHGSTRTRGEKPLRIYAAKGIKDLEEYLKSAEYELPEGPEDERNLADRPPTVDNPNTHNFDRVINQVLQRVKNNPANATFEQLSDIIEAESRDALEFKDSTDRITTALKVAKTFLMDPNNPRRVNVSVAIDEDGKWQGFPGAQKGTLYYTFTGSRIVELRGKLSDLSLTQRKELSLLNNAFLAVQKITTGEAVDFNSFEGQALIRYINDKKEMHLKNENGFKISDLFDTFQTLLNLSRQKILR